MTEIKMAEDRPCQRIVILGKTSETIRTLWKNMFPGQKKYSNGFYVHRGVSFQDSATQMHELRMGRRTNSECSMDLDSSLDLTDPSLPFIRDPRQPVTIDSGPQAFNHGNLVTSSSTMTEASVSSIPHDIKCDIINLPFDSGITDQALYYLLNKTTLIILVLDSIFGHTSSVEMADKYHEIFKTISAVSGVHNTSYNVVLAGFSNQSSEFRSVRQGFLNSPEHGNVKLHEDEIIIDQPESVNKLLDMLRQKCSTMDGHDFNGLTNLNIFQQSESTQSSSYQTNQMRGYLSLGDIAKALDLLSLMIKQIRSGTESITGLKVKMRDIRSALSGTSLYDNMVRYVEQLVQMGCLIPCYTIKDGFEKDAYNLLCEPTCDLSCDLFKASLSPNSEVRHSPVLRIRLSKNNGDRITFSSLLISYVVSECMKSWDLARKGNKYLVSNRAVAFTTRSNAVRLILQTSDSCTCIYLTVFDYSTIGEGSVPRIDKKLCQTFFSNVERAIKTLYTEQVKVDCSLRCEKAEGELDSDIGWQDVDDMRDRVYMCSACDTPFPHRVPLSETLQYWFRDQNNTDVQVSPDSSITSRDLPCEALPEVAGCFGNNWNLFFVSHGVSNEAIDRIKEDYIGRLQSQIHESLKLMKRMDRWKGKLSFGSFRTLVEKYQGVTFNFENYDKIVEKFNNHQV